MRKLLGSDRVADLTQVDPRRVESIRGHSAGRKDVQDLVRIVAEDLEHAVLEESELIVDPDPVELAAQLDVMGSHVPHEVVAHDRPGVVGIRGQLDVRPELAHRRRDHRRLPPVGDPRTVLAREGEAEAVDDARSGQGRQLARQEVDDVALGTVVAQGASRTRVAGFPDAGGVVGDGPAVVVADHQLASTGELVVRARGKRPRVVGGLERLLQALEVVEGLRSPLAVALAERRELDVARAQRELPLHGEKPKGPVALQRPARGAAELLQLLEHLRSKRIL